MAWCATYFCLSHSLLLLVNCFFFQNSPISLNRIQFILINWYCSILDKFTYLHLYTHTHTYIQCALYIFILFSHNITPIENALCFIWICPKLHDPIIQTLLKILVLFYYCLLLVHMDMYCTCMFVSHQKPLKTFKIWRKKYFKIIL